jgi:hypothetical protein
MIETLTLLQFAQRFISRRDDYALQLYGGKLFSSLTGRIPLDSFVQVQGSYTVEDPPS